MKGRSTLQERPAHHNISNTLKERSILKDKFALHRHEVIKNPVNIFADEDIKKCDEWAKDGVEGTHFTGNDYQKLGKDAQDNRKNSILMISLFVYLICRWFIFIYLHMADCACYKCYTGVKKKVAKVMSALHGCRVQPFFLVGD